jgi:hypothetical protein
MNNTLHNKRRCAPFAMLEGVRNTHSDGDWLPQFCSNEPKTLAIRHLRLTSTLERVVAAACRAKDKHMLRSNGGQVSMPNF